MQVIIDTNFLLAIQQLGVDIFEEIDRVMGGSHKLAVCQETVKELEVMLTSKSKKLVERQAAKIGLSLLAAKKVAVIPAINVDTADEAILAFASEHTDVIVATQDRELKKQLKVLGRSVLVIRQKSHVQLVAA